MSARPGIQITVQEPADGGDHPNKYNPEVSAHIRVYWPPLATEQEVFDALAEAYEQAKVAIFVRRAEWDQRYGG